MKKHSQILGMYIVLVAIVHLCTYSAIILSSNDLDWLFYFDSRIGLFFAESVIKYSMLGSSEETPPALLSWFIEVGLLVLGAFIIKGKQLIKSYIIIEGILSIPFLFFFFIVFAAGMSANHGFSVAELFIPSITILICCILPMGYAAWILRRYKTKTCL